MAKLGTTRNVNGSTIGDLPARRRGGCPSIARRSTQHPTRKQLLIQPVIRASMVASEPQQRRGTRVICKVSLSDTISSVLGSDENKRTGPAGVIDRVPIDQQGTTGQVIRVPEDFGMEEGIALTEELVTGKLLGDGVQGQVFCLDAPDGKATNKLVKIMKYQGVTAVTGLDIGMEREWLIGQQLNKLAQEGSDDVPGFVRTGDGVVTGQGEDLKFLGLLMDKVNGKELEKRFWTDSSWSNAKYTLEMLRQVLTALDRADRELGFVHGDMRIANIMEHRPRGEYKDPEYIPRGYHVAGSKRSSRKKAEEAAADVSAVLTSEDTFQLPGDMKAAKLSFKVIDFGHARLLGDKASVDLPGSPQMEQWYRKWFQGKGDVWRLLQDLSDAIDGRSWPEEDAVEVWLLLGLIREVTNVQLTPFFHASKGEADDRGWSWERIDGVGHNIIRYINRAKAFVFATKSDFTAAEALSFLDRHSHKADYGS